MNQDFIEKTKYFLSFLQNPDENKYIEIYDDLVKVINYHNYLYYIEANPIISDYEFDKLYTLLKKIEEKYPEIVSEDSPTRRLVNQLSDDFSKTKHLMLMLSLDNSYDKNDILSWVSSLKRQGINTEFHIEPKFDGVSIEVIYRNGKLFKMLTRGDGYYGEDITKNTYLIINLPKEINIKASWLSVRGEVLLSKKTLEVLNNERKKNNLTLFSNTRNAAAGIIRQKEFFKPCLLVYFYDILYFSEEDLLYDDYKNGYFHTINNLKNIINLSQGEVYNFLRSINLPVYNWNLITNDFDFINDDLIDFFKNQDIDFDGLVIKVNDLNAWLDLWVKANHVKRAIAYKFPTKEIETKLLDIYYSIGKTGQITPIAILDPVYIDGVKISRASLHNFDYIREKDIKIGDYVFVKRSADVIPYVIGPVISKRKEVKEINPPTNCPVCNSEIIKEDSYYYCSNISCPAIVKERLYFFVSKDGMDITGMGEKIINLLVDIGILKNFADIYRLHTKKSYLTKLPLIGEKKVSLILDQIEKSKEKPLHRFLASLGIRHLGIQTAKLIEEKLKNLNLKLNGDILIKYLLNKSFLLEIDGIGEKTADFIIKYFSNIENQKIIKEIEELGYKFNLQYTIDTLKGISFSITGTFIYPRDYIINVLTYYGARYDINPKSDTSILLVGSNPGNKLDIAKKYGIEILDLEQLIKKYPFLEKDFKKKNDVKQIGLF